MASWSSGGASPRRQAFDAAPGRLVDAVLGHLGRQALGGHAAPRLFDHGDLHRPQQLLRFGAGRLVARDQDHGQAQVAADGGVPANLADGWPLSHTLATQVLDQV